MSARNLPLFGENMNTGKYRCLHSRDLVYMLNAIKSSFSDIYFKGGIDFQATLQGYSNIKD